LEVEGRERKEGRDDRQEKNKRKKPILATQNQTKQARVTTQELTKTPKQEFNQKQN